MKVTFTVPATVQMVLDIDVNNIDDALETILEGEYDILSSEVLDWDYSEIEDIEEVK